MSRTVPYDKPLSDDDRRYLRQIGAHGQAMEARIDDSYPPDPDALAAFNAEERKAAGELNGVGLTVTDQAALADENARLRAELAALKAGTSAVDYSGWSKADLEAEIDRVNADDPSAKLSKGKVADMAAALEAYFAE